MNSIQCHEMQAVVKVALRGGGPTRTRRGVALRSFTATRPPSP